MSDMNNFIGLSEILTGFNRSVFAPDLDPVNIKTTYLSFWKNKVAGESGNQQLTADILALFEQLNGQMPKLSPQQIGEKMLADANGTHFVMACRQLIYLWYMGAWPTVHPQAGSETGGSTSSAILSSDSYTSGLVWKVMQAHPMGDSNYRYGYWESEPAPLNEYTGNPNGRGGTHK